MRRAFIPTDAIVDENGAEIDCRNEEDDVELMPIDPPETTFSCKTFMAYAGPGWLMSLAYLDPGNLESDLQNGAYTGYSLIWVLFLCTIAGLILQVLAARLAAVTNLNLAQACRKYFSRKTSLIIWVMTELAIIGSDIQEVLGSAVALKQLFGWPLLVGSIITGLDTFTFLLIHYFGKRLLEAFIFILILMMMACFFLNFAIAPSPAEDFFGGFVPTCPTYAVTPLVGTIGAVIMPHNIYLYGALVQSRGLNRQSELHVHQGNKYNFADAAVALGVSFFINVALMSSFANGFFSTPCAENEGAGLVCVPGTSGPSSKAVGAAVLPCINHEGGHGYCNDIGLDNAGTALQTLFGTHGKVAKNIFALGVLAAGQASTMTGTLAGQHVMAGFLDWHIPIFLRTMITRSIALGPAILVAIWTQSTPGVGDQVNAFLNIVQSVQLPFALLPVLHFCSDRSIMGDRFVLKRRFQFVCWVMALAVIIVNIVLVVQNVIGQPAWVWTLVAFFFVAYFALMFVIIRSDLAKLWSKIRGSSGNTSASDLSPAQQQSELRTRVS
eukprot:gnl/MRDRNA2_/MRDRNA2_121591_c0_seq1.p1 gnl/MRDRNA2_/MRDRNA2_121591_c0~~gnl/MRDRNA2_/MRDRNA2_121591_c0_seq1.p1  ORF type:complete len:553 (+),score=66.42 gnl/MRDRNA2_/MRDRNA2_121591_c0_seq1:44-1702(+)